MESRPADAARRALRAARRQQTRATATEDTPRPAPRTPGPDQPASTGHRPADAARAALREALAARRAAARPTEEDTGPDTPAPSTSTRGTFPEETASEEQEHPERPHGPRDTGDVAHSGDLTSSRAAAHSVDDAAPSPDEPAHPATPTSSGEPTPCGTSTPSDAPARPATATPSGNPARPATATSSDEPSAADPAPPADDHALPDRSAPPRPADAARAALRAALARRAALEDPPRTRAAGPHTSEHLSTPPPVTASRTATTAASAAPETGAPAEHPAPARHAPAQHAASRADEVRQLLAGTFAPPTDAEAEHPSPGNTPSAAHPDHGTTPHQPPDAPGPRPVSAPAPAGPSPGAAAPRLPRTMATPHRDNEHRRTFPALPPAGPDRASFAETWWGQAWLTALEKGALDTARLARGRGYAEQGRVDAITVTPGSVLAYVQGSRPRPYRAEVRLPTLDDEDWDRFLRSAAERPAHIAALLDKELPRFLADCGVPLLPGPGDLDAHCSCPDRGRPCKHAAALCYQTARVLDTDPFALLLLRGRGERELLDALSRLNATRAARADERGPDLLPGVRASQVLAHRRPLPPLPAPLPPPTHPGPPPAYPAAPGGPDPLALDQLATDAAARAHALLTTGRDPVGGLTLWQDAVRLAAARPGSGLTAATRSLYAALASATGRDTAELARAVAAWRQGGADALAVLEEPWDPPAGRFDRARPLLLAAGLPAFRPWRNRLTHPLGHRQLRLGRTGLWYAYDSEPGREDWWPRGTPDTDPVGALTGVPATEHS
ncbi:SWIM zinc finger family protein [Streptomyces thermoviolaceus]|uniref:SWIM zinc finger family protein n=1 Tax=Streptomyces thermoviolaceus TaxID=1952 RepID=UPI003869A14B|nr:SWIM zinc finger family protein [Streptomyces thermoviolaceus]